ncbi:MAG: mannose-1-phosphate guanyltransferase, partial [Candidatus Omnitrophica bacterium]|nr:mannose-1-phosphate guanyltransferase [Candidatus Omnitrophota bacterium]
MAIKENHNYAVILAGGMGSRFWPLSRSLEPKQFLSIFGHDSLFHETISRIKTTIR